MSAGEAGPRSPLRRAAHWLRDGERAPRLLLLFTAALVLAAGAVVASPAPLAREADAEAFEALVRGLGLGAAVDLSRCAADFDPRVERACSMRHEPVPLGPFLCPAHAGE